MIALLNGNPLGKGLAIACAGLIGVNALLGVAWMLPPSGAAGGGDTGAADVSGDIPSVPPAEPIEAYAEITARPLFNESRQPIIGLADGEDDEEGEGVEEVIDAPEVELAGVVITPELRIATLRVKDSKSPLSLLAIEGQPLEGDFGSWHLSRIEPRNATLESGRGEQVELELEMHDAMIAEPRGKAQQRQQQKPSSSGANEGTEESMSRADEIRQRIAERREELQRASEEGEAAPKQPPPNYQSAIQKMMQSRKDQNKQ